VDDKEQWRRRRVRTAPLRETQHFVAARAAAERAIPNELIGGAGDDQLEEPTSHASCGQGTDVLLSVEFAVIPRIDADCERVRVLLAAEVSPGPLERSGDSVVMRFYPRDAGRMRIVVKALQSPETVLARDIVRVPSHRQAGDAVEIRAVKLTSDGQAQLYGAEPVPVLVTLGASAGTTPERASTPSPGAVERARSRTESMRSGEATTAALRLNRSGTFSSLTRGVSASRRAAAFAASYLCSSSASMRSVGGACAR
jgi:hypothetical protein